MRFKRKKKSGVKKKITIILIVFFTIFTVISFYSMLVNPVLNSSLEYETSKLATNSINLAIKESVRITNLYDDLITIKYNNEGNISLIQANGAKINRISEFKRHSGSAWNFLRHFFICWCGTQCKNKSKTNWFCFL